ncbi:flagellar export chaperone FliS [Ruminiclostridium herbifermentans]|uniref:Flagellar secretion chaperone FliS n=1 Tax=Ruminiclostridium herbifermentans TaxID=2488810 RepID=A0A4U7JIV0_9FIRM|nr:flagellar export chaperone FliS [Ruminiclostridium herbifermentans]QNU67127.1 flagellar export chaperone FliS [Ruminiclostridium herbifermentans]
MVTNKGFNQYKENSIMTATPEELTLMLYNGLVKFLMQAQNAIETKNIEKANNGILRAQAIIKEFQATLDMNYEVSEGLDSLYDYMYRRLIEANLKKDVSIVVEILGYSKELRDTWAQAMKIAKRSIPVTEKIAK